MSKVSIIIPYYNSEETILRALNSVISQTYIKWELILVNDGSLDTSELIVNDFIKNNRQTIIKNICQDNKGPSAARNAGIKLAEGEYIAFLDSDDEWEPHKLKEQMEQINICKGDMVGCSFCYVINSKIRKNYFCKRELEQISFKKMLLKHYFTPSCVIIKKEVLAEFGGFNEKQRYMEDALLFTMASRKYRVFVSNKVLVKSYKFPFGDIGPSSKLDIMEWNELKNFKKLKNENYLYEKKVGLFLYIFVVCFSILKYFRRKIIKLLR